MAEDDSAAAGLAEMPAAIPLNATVAITASAKRAIVRPPRSSTRCVPYLRPLHSSWMSTDPSLRLGCGEVATQGSYNQTGPWNGYMTDPERTSTLGRPLYER